MILREGHVGVAPGHHLRKIAMQPAADQLMEAVPDQARDQAMETLLQNIGVNLLVNGNALSSGAMVAILLAITVVLGGLVSWRMGQIIR